MGSTNPPAIDARAGRAGGYTFTVFTPTYNRAHLLPRLFESLTTQTFRDFEWLVVDDGSTDETRAVVERLQRAAPFPVRYVAQQNGGKHVAVNRGVRDADGRFFAILDSDDWYPPESLERFLHHWNAIPPTAREGFVGVTALCADPSGRVIGSRFPGDAFDSNTIDLRYRHHVSGEKRGVLRTDVLRRYPYPEGLGTFIGESLVWNRIARQYQTRFVNEVLTIVDFQPGGMTDKSRALQARNAAASLVYYQELLSIGDRLPLKEKVRTYANYVRHSLHQHVPIRTQLAQVPSKTLFLCCFPAGAYLRAADARLLSET